MTPESPSLRCCCMASRPESNPSRIALVLALLTFPLLAAAVQAQGKSKLEIVPQIPHARDVTSVAFSPDGTRVLSCSRDNTIKLWDAATGALIRTFEGHSSEVSSVAFLPDGAHLLTGGSDDHTIKLWDAATGALVRNFEGQSDWVLSLAFSPDGAYVLSGSLDKTIKLWDTASGQLLHTFEGHSAKVHSVAFSPDGARVLSGSGTLPRGR
jgi:WD40 repeat protein